MCIGVYLFVFAVWVGMFKGQKECQVPWNWSEGVCEAPDVGTRINSGAPQEQCIFLTAESSF